MDIPFAARPLEVPHDSDCGRVYLHLQRTAPCGRQLPVERRPGADAKVGSVPFDAREKPTGENADLIRRRRHFPDLVRHLAAVVA